MPCNNIADDGLGDYKNLVCSPALNHIVGSVLLPAISSCALLRSIWMFSIFGVLIFHFYCQHPTICS